MTTGLSSFALGGGATQKQRVSYFYDGKLLFFWRGRLRQENYFRCPLHLFGRHQKGTNTVERERVSVVLSKAITPYLMGGQSSIAYANTLFLVFSPLLSIEDVGNYNYGLGKCAR